MAQPNMYSSYGAGSNPGDPIDPQMQYQQQSWNQYSAPAPAIAAAQPLNSFPPPYFDKNMPPPPYSTGEQRSGSSGWRNNNSSGGGYGGEPRDYTVPPRNDRGSRFDSGSSRPGTGGPGGGRFQRDYSGPTGGNRYASRDGDSSGGGQVENKRMIFISGLPQTVNENFINDVFSSECEIDVFDSGRKMIKIYSDRGVPKGECTITYRTEEGAAKIIQMFNGQCFPGSSNVMSISYAKFSGDRKSSGRGGFDRGGRGGYGGGGDRREGRDRQGYGGDRDRGGYGDRGSDRGGDRRSGYGDRGGRSGGSFGDRGGRSGGGFGDRGGFRGGRDSGGHRGGYGNNGGGQDRGFGNDRNRDRGSFNDRGGRGGFDRGGRGGRGGGGRDGRPGDWPCSCGNVNFAFRQQCNSCQAPKPAGSDGPPSNSGGPMRGPPRSGGNGGGDRHRPY